MGSSHGDLLVSTEAEIEPIFATGKRLIAVHAEDRARIVQRLQQFGARGWLSTTVMKRLRSLCPPQVPLGVYLKKIKLLSREQLSLVFQLQLHQVYQLFNLSHGKFRFTEKKSAISLQAGDLVNIESNRKLLKFLKGKFLEKSGTT